MLATGQRIVRNISDVKFPLIAIFWEEENEHEF